MTRQAQRRLLAMVVLAILGTGWLVARPRGGPVVQSAALASAPVGQGHVAPDFESPGSSDVLEHRSEQPTPAVTPDPPTDAWTEVFGASVGLVVPAGTT